MILYVHWPDSGNFGSHPLSASQFTTYNSDTRNGYLDWHVNLQNAVNATSTLLYFGSPTHSRLGMLTNGANQYASLNNSFRSEVPSSEDWAIGCLLYTSDAADE